MKFCPTCNSEYDDEFFFCEHDGNKLEDKKESKRGFNIGDKILLLVIFESLNLIPTL